MKRLKRCVLPGISIREKEGKERSPFSIPIAGFSWPGRLLKRRTTGWHWKLLKETDDCPHNLGEGKLSTVNQNDVEYYKGVCYRGLKDEKKAVEWFTKATKGPDEPKQAFYYNDENPDKIYFQGLAWRTSGNEEKAEERFKKIIAHGEKHMNDTCKIEYFAVSLPDLAIWDEDLNKRDRIHCHNVMALGWLGLGEKEKANLSNDFTDDLFRLYGKDLESPSHGINPIGFQKVHRLIGRDYSALGNFFPPYKGESGACNEIYLLNKKLKFMELL